MEETTQNLEKRFFYKQIFDFHRPSNNFSGHLGVKITSPQCISAKAFNSTLGLILSGRLGIFFVYFSPSENFATVRCSFASNLCHLLVRERQPVCH